MAQQNQSSIIDKIDKALESYYQLFNISYINNDGVGKFKLFCQENGFEDDDDIKDELQHNADSSTLTDMDKCFPLSPCLFQLNSDESTQREQEILDVIKYCYDNGKPPKIIRKQVSLDIEADTIQATKQVYQQQLSSLGKMVVNEQDLLYFLAVGYKENIPFLNQMVDAYTIDRIKHFNKTHKILQLTEWCNQYSKDMMLLQEQKKAKANSLKTAMNGYINRIQPMLQFAMTHKIKDDIEEICQYIIATPQFIKDLVAKKKGARMPFQVDLVIAVRSCIAVDIDSNDNNNDDDDAVEKKTDDVKDSDIETKTIGDIEERLKDNNSGYTKECVPAEAADTTKDWWPIDDDDEKKEIAGLSGIARLMGYQYKKFHDVLSKKDKGNKDYKFDKMYPQKKRFQIFVDRRNEDDNKENKMDQMIFFEQNGDTIPNGHVPEWYFDSIRKCLIPGKSKDETITSTDGLNGKLLTLSFHVDTAEEIRCYVIWNGAMMRFYGDYIWQMLPLLFYSDSKGFVEQNKTKELAQQFDNDMQINSN